MRRYLTAVALLLAACSPGGQVVPAASPSGPPEVQFELVRQHAEQFDVDLPDRPPGSQHELAAASYILGHLQLAGFSPRLDSVPVADTVDSTNVVALPPNGSDPEFLLAISYDTQPNGRPQRGRELGLFLEVARAITVADPEHSVAFAALGAETAESRGTRRLAQFMLDEGIDPSVLLFSSALGSQTNFYTVGACQGEANMGMATTFTETECRDIDMHNSAITDAGFQLTFIGGDIEELGRGLFDFLLGSQS